MEANNLKNIQRGKELTVSEAIKSQGEKIIISFEGEEEDHIFRVVDYALSDEIGTYDIRRALEHPNYHIYECLEFDKFKVCSDNWCYGTFDNLDEAKFVAKIVLNEVRRELYIKDAGTNEIIEIATFEQSNL
jgi:hypothetical protein